MKILYEDSYDDDYKDLCSNTIKQLKQERKLPANSLMISHVKIYHLSIGQVEDPLTLM